MGIFVRAVVTGFGMSLGAALFRKISKQLGLEEAPKDGAKDPPAEVPAEASNPAPSAG